ncbi:hypothetical protein [Paremcibacter congregatus]|uniref:tetratricopeptide repeat protein n=1 Tax=Paremcibacter congregatus TaxID=2043170 RepID=UPI0030EDB133
MTTSIIRLLIIVILGSSGALFSSGMVEAQTYDAAAAKARNKIRDRPPILRSQIFKYLVEAQEYVNEKNYDGAWERIKTMKNLDLNPEEEAQYINFSGFLYTEQKKYPEAIEAYEKLSRQPKLSAQMEDMISTVLAHLYFKTGENKKAIEYMARYLKYTEKPPAESYVFLSQAFHKLDDRESAVHYLHCAKKLHDKGGQKMLEKEYDAWRDLYLALDMKYEGLAVQQSLVKQYPSQARWRALSETYTRLIADHDETAPLSLKKLKSLQKKASKKAGG